VVVPSTDPWRSCTKHPSLAATDMTSNVLPLNLQPTYIFPGRRPISPSKPACLSASQDGSRLPKVPGPHADVGGDVRVCVY
jgi:hypothetical protein